MSVAQRPSWRSIGTRVEYRVASVDDDANLDVAMRGTPVVLNCAGPFRGHYLNQTERKSPSHFLKCHPEELEPSIDAGQLLH